MSVTLTVRLDVEQAVIAEAQRQGIPPQDLLDALLARALSAPLPEHRVGSPVDVDATLARLTSRPAPQSVDDLRPRLAPPPGSNGLEYVLGQWPGGESEATLTAALDAVE